MKRIGALNELFFLYGSLYLSATLFCLAFASPPPIHIIHNMWTSYYLSYFCVLYVAVHYIVPWMGYFLSGSLFFVLNNTISNVAIVNYVLPDNFFQSTLDITKRQLFILLGVLTSAWTFCTMATLHEKGGGHQTNNVNLGVSYPTTQRLVVAGPYRYVRNPMALGCLAFHIIDRTLFDTSLVALLYIGLVIGILTVWFKYAEEVDLKNRFGDRYETYCNNVPRWIPRWTPYYEAVANPNEGLHQD